MIAIIVLITVFVSWRGFRDRSLFFQLALSPYRVVHSRQYYRLASHMLVHGDWVHLLVNMMVFYSFAGAVLEFMDWYGFAASSLHFLTLYAGGGITAALLGLRAKRNEPGALSVGASAGVSAVVFASILFSPWDLIYLFAFVPLPGFVLGLLYLFYSWRMARRGRDNVDHMAHLYGALFGLAYPICVKPPLLEHFVGLLLHPSW